MSDAVLRTAGPADVAALADIGARSFVETFGHLYRPEDLDLFLRHHRPDIWAAQLADPAYAVCLAEVGGKAIAYAKLSAPDLPIEVSDRAIELKQFYVLNGHHGSGLANRLMDWALATARGRGADEIYLSVFTENPRAVRFYSRHGFAIVGRNAFMVGEQADEDFIMRRALEAE